MTAGRRDTLVTLQRYTATQNGEGEEVETWADLGTEWAAVFYGKGDERRQAALEQGQQAASFRMLSNALTRSLTVRDRIVVGTVQWDILANTPDMPKRGEMEATCASVAP